MIGVIIGLVEFAADKASDQIYHMLDSFLSWGNSILYITFGKYWINVGYSTRGVRHQNNVPEGTKCCQL